MAVKEEIQPLPGARRKIGPTDFHAAGVVYLPDDVRFSHLLSLLLIRSTPSALFEVSKLRSEFLRPISFKSHCADLARMKPIGTGCDSLWRKVSGKPLRLAAVPERSKNSRFPTGRFSGSTPSLRCPSDTSAWQRMRRDPLLTVIPRCLRFYPPTAKELRFSCVALVSRS